MARPQSSRWIATHCGGAMVDDTFAGFPGLLFGGLTCMVRAFFKQIRHLACIRGAQMNIPPCYFALLRSKSLEALNIDLRHSTM